VSGRLNAALSVGERTCRTKRSSGPCGGDHNFLLLVWIKVRFFSRQVVCLVAVPSSCLG
jgi:hypothetical protein